MEKEIKIYTPVFFQILVIFYVMHSSVPVVGYNTPAILNVLVVTGIYLFMMHRNKFFVKDFLHTSMLFSLYILAFLYGKVESFSIFAYQMYQIVVFPMLALYLYRYGNNKVLRRLFFIIMGTYVFTSLTTYIGCNMFPGASRALATGDELDPAYRHLYVSSNIGTFSFIYTLVLLTPLFLYFIRYKLAPRWISICVLIVAAAAIFASEYATAFIAFIFTFITLFLKRTTKIKHLVMLAVVFFTFYFIGGKTIIGDFFEVVSKSVDSEVLAERMNSISEELSGENTFRDGDVEARADFYKTSINTFLDNPLLGDIEGSAGGHSYILDNLARYGLVGFFAIILMLNTLYRLFFKSCVHNNFYSYIIISFLISIVFMLVNPKDNLMVTSFLIPLFIISYKQNSYENENTLGR